MPGRRKFRKKIIMIAALACAILAFPASAARATVDNETERELSITYSENEYDDLKAMDVSVSLYKVADMDTEGAYELLDAYKGVLTLDKLYQTDADSDDTLSAKASELAEAAEQILAIIEDGGTEPDETTMIIAYPESNENFATITLVPGIYLVQAESVQTDTYRYDFAPSLVAIPGTYEMELKPEQHLLTGDLIITKALSEYHTITGTPLFVFDVEAVNEKGETVFSDVVSLAFDAAGTKSAKVTGIPVGSKVTVTEVYAGASYEVSGSQTVTTEIISDSEPAQADFTNDYNDSLIYTTGVVNHFEVSTDTGTDGNTIYGWDWSQLKDNEQEVSNEAVLDEE